MSRIQSFGQSESMTVVDRFGVWLSGRGVRRAVGTFVGADIGDFGCGYRATLARSILPEAASLVLADVAIADDLATEPKVTILEGPLQTTLTKVPSRSLDIVLCLSVLEHLLEPDLALEHFHRILRPGGSCVLNVPTWVGKRFLEMSAFRLGMSPPREMDDHKRYYDPRDLWPMLVAAGFPPHAIRCRRHKFGLNTIAVCRNEEIIH
jgi:SAM-dependent methyltransferase